MPVETTPTGVHPLDAADFTTDAELEAAVAGLQAQIDAISVAAGGLTDTELLALADTTAGVNQLPYFDSGTTATTTTLTSAARALLDDTTSPVMLTTLGVSDFVQTIFDDPDAATVRATIDAQASDPELDTLSALSSVANLSVFANLSATTNTIPYFTSSSAMGLLLLDATTTLGTSDTVIPTQKAVKTYADAIVAGSIADASTVTKGIAKLSVAATTATNPIVVGDNDPRLTTVASTALSSIGSVTPAADSAAYFTSTTLASTYRLPLSARNLLGLTPAANTYAYYTSSTQATTASLTASGRAVLNLTGATDSMPYFTSSTAASTTGITAFGRALINAATTGAGLTSLGASTYVQTLLDDTTAPIARGTLLADAVAPIAAWGHSILYTGSSDSSSHGMATRLGLILNTDVDMMGIAFSFASANVAGLAGWDHAYRRTEDAATATTTGVGNPKRGSVYIFHGLNDFALPATGGGGLHQYSDLLPYRHALRAVISRFIMSNLYEENDASVVFQTTGGGWSTRGGAATSAGVLGNASGGRWQENTVANKTVTITVPSTFKGGTVTLGFLSDNNGAGANWSVVTDGGTPATVDARAANAVIAAVGYWTPVVLRVTGLAAGAHTIVATPTAVTTKAYFDCWWMESDEPPMVAVAKQYTPTAGGYTSAFLTQLNQSIVDVVAEFGSNVFTIETDDIIQADTAGRLSDGVHPNDRGHALIASRVADTFLSKNRTRDQHARGAMFNPYISRRPNDTPRNVLAPNTASVVPLTITGVNSNTPQTGHLLNLSDGDLNVLSYFDNLGGLVTTAAITGQNGAALSGGVLDLTTMNEIDGTTTGSLGDKISLHGSGYGIGMGIGSLAFYALSTAPIFTFRAAGATTRAYGALQMAAGALGPSAEQGLALGPSTTETLLYRSATTALRTNASLVIDQGVTVTGGVTGSLGAAFTGGILNLNSVAVTDATTTGSQGDKVTFHGGGYGLGVQFGSLVAYTAGVFQVRGVGATTKSNATTIHAEIGRVGPSSEAGIDFGDARDTTLYRSATSTLRTPGSLVVDTNATITGTAVISGAATIAGAVTHSSTVYNAGTVTNNTGLTGAGTAYFGGAITANSTAVLSGGVTITGALTTSNNIATTGFVAINSSTTGTPALTTTVPILPGATAIRVNLAASALAQDHALRVDDVGALDRTVAVYGSSTHTRGTLEVLGSPPTFSWGPGGTTAPETSISRSATSTLTVTGLLNQTWGGTAKVVAASVTDGSFAVTPASGTFAFDTANLKIWVRMGNTWRSTAALS